jgi:hypothetical protein
MSNNLLAPDQARSEYSETKRRCSVARVGATNISRLEKSR